MDKLRNCCLLVFLGDKRELALSRYADCNPLSSD